MKSILDIEKYVLEIHMIYFACQKKFLSHQMIAF